MICFRFQDLLHFWWPGGPSGDGRDADTADQLRDRLSQAGRLPCQPSAANGRGHGQSQPDADRKLKFAGESAKRHTFYILPRELNVLSQVSLSSTVPI